MIILAVLSHVTRAQISAGAAGAYSPPPDAPPPPFAPAPGTPSAWSKRYQAEGLGIAAGLFGFVGLWCLPIIQFVVGFVSFMREVARHHGDPWCVSFVLGLLYLGAAANLAHTVPFPYALFLVAASVYAFHKNDLRDPWKDLGLALLQLKFLVACVGIGGVVVSSWRPTWLRRKRSTRVGAGPPPVHPLPAPNAISVVVR